VKARENPFRTERILQVRYRPLDRTWDDIIDRLAGLGWRAAVVGPEGSGKTTLLEGLAPRLQARGYSPRPLLLDADSPRFRAEFLRAFFRDLGPRDVVLLDGADLMPRLAWLRFRRGTRKAAGLVIASHRPGLLPTLIQCATSPELLADIVREIAPAEEARLRPLLPGLFNSHQGNLRLCLRELYDRYAER